MRSRPNASHIFVASADVNQSKKCKRILDRSTVVFVNQITQNNNKSWKSPMFSPKRSKSTHDNTNRFNKRHLHLHTRQSSMSQQHVDEEFGEISIGAGAPVVKSNDGNLLPTMEEYKVDAYKQPVLNGCFWKMGALICVGVCLAIILPTVLVLGSEPSDHSFPSHYDVDCDAVSCTPVSLDLSMATAAEPPQAWDLYYVDKPPLQVQVSLPNLPDLHVFLAHQYPERGMTCQHGRWLTPVNAKPGSIVSIPVGQSGGIILCDGQHKMIASAYHLFAPVPDATTTTILPLDLELVTPSLEILDLDSSSPAMVAVANAGTKKGEPLLYIHNQSREIGDPCYAEGETVVALPVISVFGLELWTPNSEGLQGVTQTTIFTCTENKVSAFGTLSYISSVTIPTTAQTTSSSAALDNATSATMAVSVTTDGIAPADTTTVAAVTGASTEGTAPIVDTTTVAAVAGPSTEGTAPVVDTTEAAVDATTPMVSVPADTVTTAATTQENGIPEILD
eukprot:scaffold6688_cov181-Amphora_coffeaeformis.AAC.6